MALRNDEIRARILRVFYDFDPTHPGEYLSTNNLVSQLPNISENLIKTNFLYLVRSDLLEATAYASSPIPLMARITPRGIDVVEKPDLAKRYAINVQILQVGTVYGQVAQAAQGAAIAQTQTLTFDSLRKMVQERQDIDDNEKENIKKILDELEVGAQQGNLTKKAIDVAKNALAKYGWLIPPLLGVLKASFGF